MTDVIEHPILFSTSMVKAILDGKKSQTRRMVKNPSLIYGLSDDSIELVHSSEVYLEDKGWNPAQADTDLSKRGLHGWGGREYLLSHQIQRLWAEGLRGLVCVEWVHRKQGLSEHQLVPQQQENNKVGSSAGVHGVSRHASKRFDAGPALGRQQAEQPTKQLGLGDPTGELDGSAGTWDGDRWRKALGLKANERRARTFALGRSTRLVLTAPRRYGSGYEPVCHLFHSPWQVGQTLWVRETWSVDSQADLESKNPDKVWFKASEKNPEMFPRWRPSIHMPRWVSRIQLEVTDVRVERLQDISAKDAVAEGIRYDQGWEEEPGFGYLDYSRADDEDFAFTDPRDSYRTLWDKINGKGSWATNPWCWCISFKRIK